MPLYKLEDSYKGFMTAMPAGDVLNALTKVLYNDADVNNEKFTMDRKTQTLTFNCHIENASGQVLVTQTVMQLTEQD